ncbi:hypothetical protein FSARC_9757 [Fusarium sarcochroum]|uniref:Zn(2)-C6 fungal-type domain-containing protein n=1 Tax=Fusarium sarcochroum TaxID=1208366 RepID=A0A8H4TQ96_9HYPO|nr:hypothetical protein FSARC_9757 [Fusarium sarcochroum]
MGSSLPLSEQKACFGCATAKRACDKQKPSCQRYLRSKPATNSPSQHPERARLQGSARQTEHLNTPANDCMTDLLTLDTPIAWSAPYKPWFVGLETWTIENKGVATCRFSSGPSHGSPQLGDWTKSLWHWLRQWVDEGSCPFIHKQLYFDTGLPPCLQDAWTTLTAYFSKTALNKHLVMQIIEHRVETLLQSQPHDDTSFMAVPSLQTVQHLARVQALFIYQYLQFYDGCVRQRAMAERHIPTLMLWCEHLWQSATLDAVHNEQFPTTMDLSEPDAMAETLTSKNWKAWVLSESLRRTWIVFISTIAAYLTERDGWSECSGEIRFTTRRGLWDASSSAMWLELSSKRDPLFIRSLHVDELLLNAGPTEVDSFAVALMRLLIGKDDMDSWGGLSHSGGAEKAG